jgi:hypothetical protein
MGAAEIALAVIPEVGKLVNTLITHVGMSSRRKESIGEKAEVQAGNVAKREATAKSNIDMPSTEDTISELKRELVKQLNEAVGDLSRGLMIINRPCSCLELKHQLEIEGAAEELIPMDPDNTVYNEIIQWFKDNGYKVIPEAIVSGKFKEEYPRMASQFRSFRDRIGYRDERALKKLHEVLSSDKSNVVMIPLDAPKDKDELTLEEAQELAAEEARARVAKRWTEQKS